MLAGRPGARSAVAGLGPESSDALDRAQRSPRKSGGRHRPGAYLDMKIHLEKNLEEERQILLQQQKLCRNQARKYFMESNRRKKAFEEKRKEQEEKEYQIREQILQQRKQKFEEVTEKFQRAHIPLSQRRKSVFQKPVPPLEEALKQIQESNLKSEGNLPSFHRPTMNWRTIDSALPSALSKNDHNHQKQLLSKINCNKEMKENIRANFTTNKNVYQLKLEETQRLLEDQHLSSLQKFCDDVNQITNSETLSSIDSLEAGQHEEIYLTLNTEPSTSVQQNTTSLISASLQSTNLSCHDEDKLSFSKTQHINNWLTNLDAPDTRTVTPFSEILSKSNVLPSWEYFNSKEQNQSNLSRTVEKATNTANNSEAFVCCPPIFVLDKKSEKTSETSTIRTTDSTSEAFKKEKPLFAQTPAFKFSKACSTSVPQEVATFLDQEKYSELTQKNRTTSVPTSCIPVATPLVLPSNMQSSRTLAKNSIYIKEINPIQCFDKLDELKDVKDEKIKYLNCNKGELPLFSDSFQTAHIPHNTDSKDEKQTSISLSNIIPNYDLVSQHQKIKYNTHEQNGVRFLKSILKKDSKYEHDYLKALIVNQGLNFGNKKAAAIRDSIELKKEKEKGTEIIKTIKKLRWFDEASDIENEEDSRSLKTIRGITQQWSQQFHIKSGAGSKIINVPASAANSADRKKSEDDSFSENVTALAGSGTDHDPLNCSVPSGRNFAKQAWPAPQKEESKIPVHKGDTKTQKGNPQKGGAKVIIRTGSAKVPSGYVYKNRRGTVIRPQSASQVRTCVRTQRKPVMPHPPPKSTSNIRSSKNIMQVSHCQSIIPENSQNIMTHHFFNSKHVLPMEYNFSRRNQESSPPLSSACSDLVAVMPSLPSYCFSECQTLANTNYSNGTQTVTQQNGTTGCTQRSPAEESCQSVTLKTTEEESVPLWKRGHNILHQNEKAAVSDSTSEFLMIENLVEASMPEDKILTVMHSKQLQKPNLALNKTQQLNICTLSAEEQKILQSLNHLNERLHYVQETICKNPSIRNTLKIVPFLNTQPKINLSPDVGSRLQRKY
ncbi:centrosomal protein of 126 kDa isoform X2 [Nycticebus coucang]|uniref:centrosomal protein of 126 kDa isoform X2 n=1 Tax=Nycticebus coucang TaxID=9470 RepID=UPI00234E31CA|nr:centrosomal protein of 126 kDa isoform X2 [Nycticebus coucang]